MKRTIPISFITIAFAFAFEGAALADDPKPGAAASHAAGHGDPKKNDLKHEVKQELKQELKKDREELKDAKKDLRDAVKSGDAGAVKEALDGVKNAREEFKSDRQELRKARRDELVKKWGEAVNKDEVRDELKKHDERMARLKRVNAVAKEAKKEGIAKRAEAAMNKENKRHEEQMNKLTKEHAK